MRFLQIKNTKDGEPKMLEMDEHFDIIWNGSLWLSKENIIGTRYDDEKFVILDVNQCGLDDISPFTHVCKISDCYQSRPLLILYNYTHNTQFYEFDINSYASNYPRSVVIQSNIRDGFTTLWLNGWINDLNDTDMQYNLGSIFSEEKKIKYRSLYKVSCEYIKHNN